MLWNKMKNSGINSKQKIAVLGGGMGALSAVYGITNQPNWEEKYDITVYQMGWRLGGKGASGRNTKLANRIEEHGLHIWFGFYDNAFKIMKDCYKELDRKNTLPDCPILDWDDAFKPHDLLVFREKIKTRWVNCYFDRPTNDFKPGTECDIFKSPWSNICLLIEFLHYQYQKTDLSSITTINKDETLSSDFADKIITYVKGVVEKTSLNKSSLLLGIAKTYANTLDDNILIKDRSKCLFILDLLNYFKEWLWNNIHHDIYENDDIRHLWYATDLGLSMIRGIIHDEIYIKGFDSIDHLDFKEWIQLHGASDITSNSPIIDGLYSGNFSYIEGDTNRPNFAAGVFLQCMLRIMLTYKGSFIYKLQAGMGEIVFAPIYETLKQRGVVFKFFHQTVKLNYDDTSKSISSIKLKKQVKLLNNKGIDTYDPMLEINNIPCWPVEPKFEQIQNGEQLQKLKVNLESNYQIKWKDEEFVTLVKGQDYDQIILGISIAALPPICSDLIESLPKWREMVNQIKTVQTQAMQLWLNKETRESGWPLDAPLMVTFERPHENWLDASHLITMENWKPDDSVKSIAYFCSAMPIESKYSTDSSSENSNRYNMKILNDSVDWLNNHSKSLWPNFCNPDTSFNWNILVDPNSMNGAERLQSQYLRANIDPSEQFVISTTNATKYRMRTDESGVINLFLTGDWIYNGFNVGCIESATMSGLQCSRAISGFPQQIIGENFFVIDTDL